MDYTWHVFAINTTDKNELRMFRDDKVIEMNLGSRSVTVSSRGANIMYRFDSMYTGMTLAEATDAIKKWDNEAPDDVIEKIKAIQEKIKE